MSHFVRPVSDTPGRPLPNHFILMLSIDRCEKIALRLAGSLAVSLYACCFFAVAGMEVSVAESISSSDRLQGKITSHQTMPAAVKLAQAALRSGDVGQALRHLREACEQDPQLAPAEISLANLYKAEGDFVNARATLEQAAARYPEDPEPHLMFGDLAWSERRLSDCDVQYERGRSLAEKLGTGNPRKQKLEVWGLAGSGSVAAARRNYELAQGHFEALLKIDPSHAQAHNQLGDISFALNRPQQALSHFQASHKGQEASAVPYLTMANLCLNSGKLDQAEQWIVQAIEAAPQDAKPLLAMARLQLQARNDAPQAKSYLDRVTKLDPDTSEVRMLRGLAAWQLGDVADAERTFESLVLEQPGNLTASAHLACVLAEQGDPNQLSRAWELVELNATNHPESTETVIALGWVAYHRGSWKLAEQHLGRVAALPDASRDAKYYYARCLFRLGSLSAALAKLDEALTDQGWFLHLREATQWQRDIKAQKTGS